MVSKMKYQHLPDSLPSSRTMSKFVRRWPLLQIVFGIIIGFSLTSTFQWESVEDVAEKILTVVKDHNGTKEYPSFFLRCVVIIERKAQKPTAFASALADGWTKRCNETIFYTNSKNVAKVVKDHNVILIDSPLSPFHWSFYRSVVDHATKTPASWTLVGDEMLYVVVENLRKSLSTMDPTKPIVVGRVKESSSLLAWLFPLISWRGVSVEAGIVFSNSALPLVIRECSSTWQPRSTGSAIFQCTQSMNVQLVDPVDEDGAHLFHEKNMKSLIGTNTADAAHYHQGKSHVAATCCSEHAATFGGMSYKEQRVAEYANYQVKVFGNEGVTEYVPTTTVKPTTKAVPKKVEPKKVEPKKVEPKKAEESKNVEPKNAKETEKVEPKEVEEPEKVEPVKANSAKV